MTLSNAAPAARHAPAALHREERNVPDARPCGRHGSCSRVAAPCCTAPLAPASAAAPARPPTGRRGARRSRLRGRNQTTAATRSTAATTASQSKGFHLREGLFRRREAPHRRAPRRPDGGRAEGRRWGAVQHARCAPHAGGVTDARDRIDYERFSSRASAAGATPAAGSASRPSAS